MLPLPPMSPRPGSCVVASDSQVACEVGHEVVILHLEEGLYYGLNEVGARIWQLIQQPRSLEEIADAIAAEFEVEPAQCLDDVRELVLDLARHQLATVSE